MKTIFTLQKNRGDKDGFTIIETLVAVAILMIAIAGPLTIAHKGLLAAIYAHDQVTATYLGQDAVEYVKNVRDNNLINGRPWLDKLIQCTEGSPCKVDTIYGNPNAGEGDESGAKISSCTNNSTGCLLYISLNGYTVNSSGTQPSKFSRYFYIKTGINNTDQAKLVAVVDWTTGTINNVTTYESELFNILK